jgi:hypothetical protein
MLCCFWLLPISYLHRLTPNIFGLRRQSERRSHLSTLQLGSESCITDSQRLTINLLDIYLSFVVTYSRFENQRLHCGKALNRSRRKARKSSFVSERDWCLKCIQLPIGDYLSGLKQGSKSLGEVEAWLARQRDFRSDDAVFAGR